MISAERSASESQQNVEAFRAEIAPKVGAGIAKRPRTAPVRKKALHNGLLLIGIALLFLWLYVRMTGGGYEQQDEYRILFLAHLSGQHGASGGVRLKAAQMAADMLNDQGGIKGQTVRLVAQDVPENADDASSALREVLRDRSISTIISVCGEDASVALSRTADEYEVPIVAVESSRSSTTIADERPILYAFRMNSDNEYKGDVLAYFSIRGLGRKRAALIERAHDEDAREIADAFEESYVRQGGDIACRVSYTPRGGLDVSSVRIVVDSGATCVVFADPTEEAGEILRALRSSGSEIPAVGIAFDDERDDREVENCWMLVPSSQDDPQLMSFRTSYVDRYGETLHRADFAGAVMAYDAVRWAADALFRSPGTNGEALRHSFLSTRNLALSHATLTIDPRTHAPQNKAVTLLYSTDGSTKFQRRFRPQ